MLQESNIKLTWFDKTCNLFQILYYLLRYGFDGTREKLNNEIEKLRKETKLLRKLQRKAINENKGGKMCKRPTR